GLVRLRPMLCARELRLFPYTTLFRSRRVAVAAAGDHPREGCRERQDDSRSRHHASSCLVTAAPPRMIAERTLGAQCAGVRQRKGDRKSTRLNSSHLGISYAVFCLKKK